MQAAGLTHNDEDQVRIQARANFIIISTPHEERATRYTGITAINHNGQQYPVVAHVSAPSNTALGVIFNIPSTDTAEQIQHSLMHYNPDLGILDAKRLNSSNIVQILFEGTTVPFWVRYRAVTYRCKPFKRKTEACTTCWHTGHRKDVCPTTQPPSRCVQCGLINPPDPHKCTPKCIVCGGAHLTGSAECPRRFQPRRQAPTYAQVTAAARISTDEASPSQRQASQSPALGKPTKQQDSKNKANQPPRNPNAEATKVSTQHSSLSSSLHNPPNIPNVFLQELRTIRQELAQLRKENAMLRQENLSLKHAAQPSTMPINPPPPHSSTQSSTELPPPPPSMSVDSNTSPPSKRRATESTAPIDDSQLSLVDQIAAVERTCHNALSEQKAEYIHLHQTLLTNQATTQAMVEALKAEMHACLTQFHEIKTTFAALLVPSASSQPLPDLPDDPSQDF
ncbi:uncharacterized protein LOC144139741 [Haemaphysalis longicornis]